MSSKRAKNEALSLIKDRVVDGAEEVLIKILKIIINKGTLRECYKLAVDFGNRS